MSAKKHNSAAKAMKNPKAIIIAAIAILLVIAIFICVLRFGFPDKWDALMLQIFGEEDGENGGSDAGSGTGTGTGTQNTVQGENNLLVHFVNIGQGDFIYIQFPDGEDMVIDAGSTKGGSAETATGYLEQYDTDGKINHLMLTHTDEDHVAYLDEIIYAYEVENIYMPNVRASAPTGTSVRAQQARENLAALEEEKGDEIAALFTDEDTVSTIVYAEFFIAALSEENCTIHLNMDDDENTNNIVIRDEANTYNLTFYCPTVQYYADDHLSGAVPINAVSPVGILTYNGRRIVLTGDSNEKNEPIIAARIGFIDCDVLKVAHHGSETSSLNVFLAAVTCEFAVISCGTEGGGHNYYHPRQATLDRLSSMNFVYRTDTNGTVILTVNGSGEMTFTVETEVDLATNLVGADTLYK